MAHGGRRRKGSRRILPAVKLKLKDYKGVGTLEGGAMGDWSAGVWEKEGSCWAGVDLQKHILTFKSNRGFFIPTCWPFYNTQRNVDVWILDESPC